MPIERDELRAELVQMKLELLERVATKDDLARHEAVEMGILKEIKEDNDDHEERLRLIEKWKYLFPSSLLLSLFSIALAITLKEGILQ